jgi:predicted RNA-binding protein YlxR (DUF448 family)
VSEGGTARPDPTARQPGRGSYVCRSSRCFEALQHRRRRYAIDFETEAQAFRLAIQKGVVQNVAGATGEN